MLHSNVPCNYPFCCFGIVNIIRSRIKGNVRGIKKLKEKTHRIKIDLCVGKIAKWLDHLLCKSKDLSLDVQGPCKYPTSSLHTLANMSTHITFPCT